MDHYITTFHTHLSALRTSRTLTAKGVPANMMPVPRKVSSSCGTCVSYQAETPMVECMDEDAESIFIKEDDGYRMVHTFEEE